VNFLDILPCIVIFHNVHVLLHTEFLYNPAMVLLGISSQERKTETQVYACLQLNVSPVWGKPLLWLSGYGLLLLCIIWSMLIKVSFNHSLGFQEEMLQNKQCLGHCRYLPKEMLLNWVFLLKLTYNEQQLKYKKNTAPPHPKKKQQLKKLKFNWCQHWFEYFPNPPINILSMIENVLAFHDKELLQHFINHDVTSQLYAWPLLETVFSEVLTREEWLKLFDNVFSNHPSFLLMTVAAYNICSRAPLLNCKRKDDFEYFFHHRNNLDISAVIREVYRLLDTTPTDIHPDNMLDAFVALTKGQYPVFNQYPKFIVDYQTQERERIRNDELDYLRERQAVEDMQAEVDQQRVEDEAWYQKQELLRRAEETRREILLQEEEKMIQQRQRLK
ncbi:hypothetical protein FD755_025137, partial [Muntiacus reevesi]